MVTEGGGWNPIPHVVLAQIEHSDASPHPTAKCYGLTPHIDVYSKQRVSFWGITDILK